MKKMMISQYEPDYSYRQCVSAIVDEADRAQMLAQVEGIKTAAVEFLMHTRAGSTCTIPALRAARGEDPVVLGDITKSKLVKLYEYYMVGRQPGRSVYDAIYVAANDLCPICGGVGRVKTLDHYLPKANYPQLSVLPYNLVPACRDCNTEKGNPIITDPAKQLIHPYYDQACFYDEAWIFATTSHELPCVITYRARPPEHWLAVNQERANNHFDFFDIAERYRIRASEEVGTLVDQRRGIMRDLSPEIFRQQLLSVADSPTLFANHWRKIMYKALAEDEWFCAAEF